MATSYILALDQGTTSSRSILFDRQGNIAGIAQRDTIQISPQQDWAEQDAEDILKTLIATTAEVIAMTGITGAQIDAVGIANQRETIVVWDRITGKPLYHAITSQDKRTARYCQKLKESVYSKGIHSMTGLVINTSFSASKIQWVLDNVLGAREKARKGELAFGTIDSWIIWNLTNGALHVTDVSNASRTLLLNIKTCQWNDELLELFTIPRSMTPDVRASSEVFGTTEKLIPGFSILIAGIAGNQQASLLGQMCIQPGLVKNTCENDSCVMMNTGKNLLYSKNDLQSTIAWQIGNKVEYALEGIISMKEMEIGWWKEALMHLVLPDETNTVSQLRNSDEVYVVPAGVCSPGSDYSTCVNVFGLTNNTTEAQLSAAVLDSIAYQCYGIIKAME